jgi:uncharacterized protein YndB with AHSA1/START domain
MTDQPVADDELEYVRVFDAPRALVYRCMIEPEHLTHFWGPAGMTTPLENIRVEPHPGGVFETVMVSDSDGSRYTMRAVYDEITEPERIVWSEDSGAITTSTFTDLGDGRTEVRIRQRNVPEAFRSPAARAGFVTSLDRLAAHLSLLTEHGTA